MKLERLSLSNCSGFKQLDIDFEPDVTLIAGVNGVGKSTLLRVIATLISKTHRRLNLSRQHPLRFDKDIIFVGQRATSAKLMMNISNVKLVAELHAAIDWRRFEIFQLIGLTKEANHQNMLAVLFTPKRQLPGRSRSQAGTSPFDPSIAFNNALYDREVELREFMHWFRTQEKLGVENEPRRLRVLDALRAVVSELVPDFSNLRVQQSPRLGFVVDKRGQPFYLHQLSDGERGLLALVFDLTRRLAIANPEIDNPIAEGVALVLIDEIELHLHPKWQRDILGRLRHVFPNCQFVVTTHSPLVLGEVEARCVRFLEYQDGKVVATTPTEAYGMDANRILKELMETPVRNKKMESELSNLFALIDQENFDQAREKIIALEKQLGASEPELTRAHSLITFLEGSE
jgi:predicted ATP-binding protein involved in virulence